MSGVLRLGNTGAATGRSTIQATATSDATFSLPSAGGTILTTDFDTIGTITWNGSNINITNADLNVDNGTLFVDESTNRVGIGTTTVDEKLHVSGGNIKQQLAAATNGGFNVNNGTSDLVAIGTGGFAANGGSATDGGVRATNNLVFATGSGTPERARIDSSGRLLVGIASSRSYTSIGNLQFQIEGTSFQYSSIGLTNNQNTADSSYLVFNKTRGGSVGSNDIVQEDDLLGALWFQGANNAASTLGATITCAVDGTPGAAAMPSRLSFNTNSGTTSAEERMRINSAGNVGIGLINPNARLTVHKGSDNSLDVAIFTGGDRLRGLKIGTKQYNGYNDGGVVYNAQTGGTAGSHHFQVNNGVDAVKIDQHGIKFGTDTASQNALDDYEEGSFTPTANDGVYATAIGRYVKIGRLVTVNGYISGPTVTSSSSIILIRSLPFPIASNYFSTGTGLYRYVSVSTNYELKLFVNGSDIEVWQASGGIYSQLVHSDFNSSSAQIFYTLSYETDS